MKRLLVAAAMFLLPLCAFAQGGAGVIGHSATNRLQQTATQHSQMEANMVSAFRALRYVDRLYADSSYVFSMIGLHTALGTAMWLSNEDNWTDIQNVMNPQLPVGAISTAHSFLLGSLERKTGFKLGLDNVVWVDDSSALRRHTRQTTAQMKKYYEASIGCAAPDSLERMISRRIAESSGGIIDPTQRVTDSRTGGYAAVMTDITWVHGSWQEKFFPINGYRAKFSPAGDTKPHEIEYMGCASYFPYYDDIENGLQYAEFPFADESQLRAVSLVVVLPRKAKSLGKVVESHLTPERWQYVMDNIHPARLKVGMPKFVVETRTSMKPLWESWGIKEIFVPNNERLYMSDVVQVTAFSVDYDGSNAIPMEAEAQQAPRRPGDQSLTIFNMNRPFLFFLRDRNTGSILMAGRINDVKR